MGEIATLDIRKKFRSVYTVEKHRKIRVQIWPSYLWISDGNFRRTKLRNRPEKGY